MVIFGGRIGEKKVNDTYLWNITSPTPSLDHCSLRSEMVVNEKISFFGFDYFISF